MCLHTYSTSKERRWVQPTSNKGIELICVWRSVYTPVLMVRWPTNDNLHPIQSAPQRHHNNNTATTIQQFEVVVLYCRCGVVVVLLWCYCGVVVLLLWFVVKRHHNDITTTTTTRSTTTPQQTLNCCVVVIVLLWCRCGADWIGWRLSRIMDGRPHFFHKLSFSMPLKFLLFHRIPKPRLLESDPR